MLRVILTEDNSSAPNSHQHEADNLHKPKAGKKTSDSEHDFAYLDRDALLLLDKQEPKWRRIRIGLLISFAVIWLALLLGVIIIVVLSKKCPLRPNLPFWQSNVFYFVDPFAFKDSNNDWVGDFSGLSNAVSYLKDDLGVGSIILTSIANGYYTGAEAQLGHVTDYKKVDPALGTIADFRQMIKTFHKNGIETVISLDFNAIGKLHEWAVNRANLMVYNANYRQSRYRSEPFVNLGSQKFYSVDEARVDLNLESERVLALVKDVVKFWLEEEIDGILLQNCALYIESLDTSGKPVLVCQLIYLIHSSVLIVDSGDTGFGLSDEEDKGAMFLGTEKSPGAHLVFHRQFVTNRGWKSQSIDQNSKIANVHKYNKSAVNMKQRWALPTATDTDIRNGNLLSTAAVFLLPSSPILYYGSELGFRITNTNDPPSNIYPMNKVPNLGQSNDDITLTCHLPMPWDSYGKMFSPGSPESDKRFIDYLKKYEITETVAVGLPMYI
ncbi:solute carrier family 3 (neutral and basic amino acid transporter), member 1 [Paragonimus westermani]|uniref:Solute carrier family 3 (Neutral and basic amino acid transporter), member 1 n=1 Tax=Paragonimus westermani TaxID=34504 RepID=A0A5J4P152_9TREM|nr:solute carrier family 3 (neutral and basic amino acid transporter), member 1 [Paragonimus westermani]